MAWHVTRSLTRSLRPSPRAGGGAQAPREEKGMARTVLSSVGAREQSSFHLHGQPRPDTTFLLLRSHRRHAATLLLLRADVSDVQLKKEGAMSGTVGEHYSACRALPRYHSRERRGISALL
jgi:hypothetical protein